MKRIIGIASAALLGTSLLASPALAQVDTTIGANAGAAAKTGDTGISADSGIELDGNAAMSSDTDSMNGASTVDSGTTAAIDSNATFDSALSAIRDTSAARDISAMSDVSSVNIVRIGELENADIAAIQTTMSENQPGIDELQTAIEANSAVSSQLEAQSVDVSAVVAANVGADGDLTVFVR